MDIQQLVDSIELEMEECVQNYRHLHTMPEIGLEEQLIASVEGVQVDQPLPQLPTAIVARISTSNPINTILLRCELDALSFKEKSGLPHCSTNNLHHACSHDAHMATLIAALKHTAKHREHLRRNVIFCFQPGEEGKAGASKLFEAKHDLLEGVEECYAIHFTNAGYPGAIGLGKGPVTALSSRLTIKIEGTSSHCMIPNTGVDANFIGCSLVGQLYALIGMKVPPLEGATLVVYQVTGGTNNAKVSDHFELSASIRTTTLQSYHKLEETITKLTEGLCLAYGAKPTIEFTTGFYRPVINDGNLVQKTRNNLHSYMKDLNIISSQKSFGGEDFCQFSERKPSCYIAVGSALPDSIDPSNQQSKFPLHSPFHKFDEKVFLTSTKIWSTIIFA